MRQGSETQGGESRGLKMGQQYMDHCANSYLILGHVSTSQRPVYFWAEQISSLQSKDLCTPTNSPVGERIINPNLQMTRWRLTGNTAHPKLHSRLVAKSKFLFSFKTCAPSMQFHHKFHVNVAFYSVMYLCFLLPSPPDHPSSDAARCFMPVPWHQGPGRTKTCEYQCAKCEPALLFRK